MENASLTHDQRLRRHGERLLRALDDQEMPQTYAEILRAARALIAVKKALDLIHKAVADTEAIPAPAPDSDAPTPVLNRKMRRRLEAQALQEMRAEDRLRRASG